MQRLRAVLGLALATLALAGCTGDSAPSGMVGSVEDVPFEAPSEVGDGEFRFVLRVVAERPEGEPLEGVAVAIHRLDNLTGTPDRFTDLIGVPAWPARTSPDGRVVAHLEPDARYAIVAERAGWTRELVYSLTANQTVAGGDFVVPLYRSSMAFDFEGSFPSGVGTSKPGSVVRYRVEDLDPQWRPTALEFSGDDAVQAAYVWRVADVNATVTWNNTETAYGDLGIGVGFLYAAEAWWYSDVHSEAPAASGLEEQIRLPHRVTGTVRAMENVTHLMAGPTTGSLVVAPDGLPYAVHVEVQFSGDAVDAGQPANNLPLPVPGAGAAAVVLGLAAAVALARPRRA